MLNVYILICLFIFVLSSKHSCHTAAITSSGFCPKKENKWFRTRATQVGMSKVTGSEAVSRQIKFKGSKRWASLNLITGYLCVLRTWTIKHKSLLSAELGITSVATVLQLAWTIRLHMDEMDVNHSETVRSRTGLCSLSKGGKEQQSVSVLNFSCAVCHTSVQRRNLVLNIKDASSQQKHLIQMAQVPGMISVS